MGRRTRRIGEPYREGLSLVDGTVEFTKGGEGWLNLDELKENL